MPVREISPGRFRWGTNGKVYRTRAEAEAQGRAAYASGYRDDAEARLARRQAAEHWGASRRAEALYTQAIVGILGAAHKAVLEVVEREHLPAKHDDGDVATRVPLVRQAHPWTCGVAATLAVLRRYEPDHFAGVTEEQLAAELGTTPEGGTAPNHIANLLHRELGHPVDLRTRVSVADLEAAIDRDEPAIIAVQAWRDQPDKPWSSDWTDGHYVVVVGYDADRIRFMDPSTSGGYAWIPKSELPPRWHDRTGAGETVRHLAVVVRGGRQDAAPPGGTLGGKFLHRVVTWQRPRVVDAFSKMAADVNATTLATAQLYGVHVRHVAGVDSVIEHAREANVDLITEATADFLSQVRDVLDDTEGEEADTIRDAIEARVGVSRSRAALIGRDQTLKLASNIVQARQRSAGIKRYVWSGVLDERERPMHRELEGQVFSWDDPPVTNEDGDHNHPGEDFQCRCVPAPYLEDLEEPDEDGPDEEAAE